MDFPWMDAQLHAALMEEYQKINEADAKHLQRQIAGQLRGLLIKKAREEGRVMETITLETGQVIKHHAKDKCAGEACVLHNPIPGPWDEWPRIYNEALKLMYRMCEHRVLHPAVEDVLRVVKAGASEAQIAMIVNHCCCGQCVCLPRAGLPDDAFLDNPEGARQFYETTAIHAAIATATSTRDNIQETPIGTERFQYNDPNRHAKRYVWRLRTATPMELLLWLHNSVLDAHHVSEVDRYLQHFHFQCDSNECHGTFNKNDDGTWYPVRLSAGSYCPTMSLALLAGYQPVDWNAEDEEDEE